ncbi:hypothetical protein B0H11DRAFT_2046138 [Mycena galericulata]|nr:hypothetical protein B0H11DRAFT_2046138 [Mycena galericulata]
MADTSDTEKRSTRTHRNEEPHVNAETLPDKTPTHIPDNPGSAAVGLEGRPTDYSKLADAIHELVSGTGAQYDNLNFTLDRLTTAVETLAQPQSTDNNTAFWTAYKTLADEFDKEFQRKYGNDLDTSLIFAGLFSAVSSAFIIQIQPQFQQQSSPTDSLVLLLAQNITGVAPSMVPMTPTEPATLIIITQCLLYFSLFSTLLAALLSVLAKQWLVHYDSVGERGTIEERGLERQRKFDGMRRWKFDFVMQTFPLLLQSALLLSAAALSIYLWTVHYAIAAIVMALTSLGFVLYTTMVVSALVSPDSPFQTSLTALLASFIRVTGLPKLVHRLSGATRWLLYDAFALFRRASNSIKTIPGPLLPKFSSTRGFEPQSDQLIHVFEEIPDVSRQIPAVVWMLETTTDPRMVEAAAAIVPELQWWPVDLDLWPSLIRLAEVFQASFDGSNFREGMEHRAIRCITAFTLLNMLSEKSPNLWTPYSGLTSIIHSELGSLVRLFHALKFDENPWPQVLITQWCLRLISAQDPPESYLGTLLTGFQPNRTTLYDLSLFADFLFCINSFFTPPEPRDLSLLDKSPYLNTLTTLVFDNLNKRLDDPEPLDLTIAENVVTKVAHLATDVSFYHPGEDNTCRNSVYRFCGIPGLRRETITSAVQLVRMNTWYLDDLHRERANSTETLTWVYTALEHLPLHEKVADVVGDFLQVLFHYSPIHGSPTPNSLRVVLWALSSGEKNAREGHSGDTYDSFQRVQSLAFSTLCSSVHWFLDETLQPILQENSVWTLLGASAWFQRSEYIALGHKLLQAPSWKGVLSDDFPGWLDNLEMMFDRKVEENTVQEFQSVLFHVWDADDGTEFGEEKTLAMAFTATARMWDRIDFSRPEFHRIFRLAKCTVSAAFCARYPAWRPYNPSQKFKDTIFVRLGDSLGQAAKRAKEQDQLNLNMTPDVREMLNAAADVLSKLVLTLDGDLKSWLPPRNDPGQKDIEANHWRGLKEEFKDHLSVLSGLIENISSM